MCLIEDTCFITGSLFSTCGHKIIENMWSMKTELFVENCISTYTCTYTYSYGLPWWLSDKESAWSAGATGDADSIIESGRSPRGRHGNSPQYSCLESPKDRGAWWAMVHRVTKSQTQLKRLSIHYTYTYTYTNTYTYTYTCFPGSSVVKNLPAKQETWA